LLFDTTADILDFPTTPVLFTPCLVRAETTVSLSIWKLKSHRPGEAILRGDAEGKSHTTWSYETRTNSRSCLYKSGKSRYRVFRKHVTVTGGGALLEPLEVHGGASVGQAAFSVTNVTCLNVESLCDWRDTDVLTSNILGLQPPLLAIMPWDTDALNVINTMEQKWKNVSISACSHFGTFPQSC
jgi:hypothetical protein